MANLRELGGFVEDGATETPNSLLTNVCASNLHLKNGKIEASEGLRADGNALKKLNKQSIISATRKQSQANTKLNFPTRKKDYPLLNSDYDISKSTEKRKPIPPLISLQNGAVNSYSHLNSISKKKKGRPKKSLSTSAVKDNVREPQQKKFKSPPVGVEFNALTLAIEMGFERPYEKITVKSSGNDKEDEATKQISPIEIIQQLIDYKKSCKCVCLADLRIQDIASHRVEITLLDRHSRDFFIMGLLRCGAVTFKETYHHNNRIRNRFSYRLMNTKICHCCFLAVNNIGEKYLKNLKKHFAEHGVTSRLHGNLGRKPYHAISNSDITDVVEFINRYASDHGVPAARRSKNSMVKSVVRLPPSDNVTSVHKKYKEFYELSGKRTVALTSFRKVWNRHLPHIKFTVKDPVSPVKNIPPNVGPQELVANVDSDAGQSVLKRMLKMTNDNQHIDDVSRSSDLRAAASQKVPVNVPYEYSSNDMSHNQMMSFNMYLNDGDNHDALQYGYIFTSNSLPVAHHFPTNIVSSSPQQSVHTSSKTNVSHNSPDITQQSSPRTSMNTSVKHTSSSDAFTSGRDKHLLLLSPSSSLETNPSQLHPVHLDQKASVPVFAPSSLINHSNSDVHQQTSSPVESGLANLSQQIHMSLFQQIDNKF